MLRAELGNLAAGGGPGVSDSRWSVSGLDSVVTVTAEADPVNANTRLIVTSPVGGAPVGDSLASPVVVGVRFHWSRHSIDVPSHLLALDGGKASATADPHRFARSRSRDVAAWIPSRTQRLRVQVGTPEQFPRVTIKAKAEPGRTLLASGVNAGEVRPESRSAAQAARGASGGRSLRQSGIGRMPSCCGAESAKRRATARGHRFGRAREAGNGPWASTAGTQRLDGARVAIEKALVVTAKGLAPRPRGSAFASRSRAGIGRTIAPAAASGAW